MSWMTSVWIFIGTMILTKLFYVITKMINGIKAVIKMKNNDYKEYIRLGMRYDY